MALTRRNAFILYFVVLIFLLIVVGVGQELANVICFDILVAFILGATVYYLWTQPAAAPVHMAIAVHSTDEESDDNSADHNNQNVQMPMVVVQKRDRLYFLDNLKSILAAIVVVGHIICIFDGNVWYYKLGSYYNTFQVFSKSMLLLIQTYLMCLFFFIAGYFTPSSYHTKGRQRFLHDKFKRLGPPFLFYFFVLHPLFNLLLTQVFITNQSIPASYSPDPGPCWFIAWLLIFNVCYAMIDDSAGFYQKTLPSTCKLVLYGVGCGFITLWIVVPFQGNLWQGTGSGFLFMPVSIGALPFDILFFIGGTLAAHNNWLTPITSQRRYAYIIWMVIVSLVVVAWYCYAYVVDIGNGIFPDKDAVYDCDKDHGVDDSANRSYSHSYSSTADLASTAVIVLSGVCTIVLSLGVLQFAARFMTHTNAITRFFSRTAYVVFVIHPLVIAPVAWSWTKILYHINGVQFVFCDEETVSHTDFGSDSLLWLGWIYCVLVSFAILYPLTWCIKKIPVINKIM